MTISPDQLLRAKQKEARRIKSEEQAAAKRRDAQSNRRKREKELETARRFVLGKVVDLVKGSMSHEEKATMCGWVTKAALTDNERALIPEFTVHLVRETPKVIAADFAKAGK